MRVVVIQASEPVVTFAEAATRLRLGTAEQTDVEAMIAAACAMFDGPTGWLGRALGEQTLELRCDAFHDCEGNPVRLPYPPIAALVSVKYLDSDGVEQTAANGDFELLGDELVPAFGKSLPATLARREAVRIRYSAGYDADMLPANVKAAILLAVGDMHRFRETLAMTSVDELPSAASVNNLVGSLRVYS